MTSDSTKALEGDAGEAIEEMMAHSAVGRRHLLPILVQCLVGKPVALMEWSDDRAFGMMLMCDDDTGSRLVFVWAKSECWNLNSPDHRKWLSRGPVVVEAMTPHQLSLEPAERKAALELLADLPDKGVVFPDAASRWDQLYWFTTWRGDSPRTVAVAPLAFDYILEAVEIPDIAEVGKATGSFAAFARYAMDLMHAHVKKQDPERATDIPLPHRNYNRAGPMTLIPEPLPE